MDAAIEAVMQATDEHQPVTESPAREKNTIRNGNQNTPDGFERPAGEYVKLELSVPLSAGLSV